MTYQETLQYLYGCAPVFEQIGAHAYKEGLDNTVALDNHFNHPHKSYKTIHVAGTNGKGSVSHTLASILQADGLKTGLYTSPHLLDFRERIRIGGKPVDEGKVIDFVDRHKAFFAPLHPSFFELATAMAFRFFEEEGVDVAVVEVGLGGRLDCTNIILPELSVITNISLDHTDLLGNSIVDIAREKAGIIKPHTPVIIGEATAETRNVFCKTAEEAHAPIIFAEDRREVLCAESTTCGMAYETRNYGRIVGDLCGSYQALNTNTALCAANIMLQTGLLKHKESIPLGISDVSGRTGLMGRWQKVADSPTVVCDTGHNPAAWAYVRKQLAEIRGKLSIVFGMVDDKDVGSVLEMLPKGAKYYFTQADTKRAIPAETLKDMAMAKGLAGEAYTMVEKAVKAAVSASTKDGTVLVAGSNYVVAEALPLF